MPDIQTKVRNGSYQSEVPRLGRKIQQPQKFAVHGVTSRRDKVGYSRNESPSLSSTSHDIHSSLPILSLHPSKPVVDSASNPLQPPLTESKNAATSISAQNSSNQLTSISWSTSKSALPSLEHTKDCGVDVEDSQTFWGDDYIMANAMLGIESSGSDADADWDPTISTGGKDLSSSGWELSGRYPCLRDLVDGSEGQNALPYKQETLEEFHSMGTLATSRSCVNKKQLKKQG
ncbi:hypothetical protein BS47DRAFT_1363560 [Hydnum rufescens UP504]|uniref:Uncharacterized protein n=1 Tax=Hydnum rufescens UP504 TaxID=1448309 RepID=A0A9P6DUM3_9AGAM|nr:hypothetical protein BS47DRAFT_1363560 [Hydnum rufescens UP504]